MSNLEQYIKCDKWLLWAIIMFVVMEVYYFKSGGEEYVDFLQNKPLLFTLTLILKLLIFYLLALVARRVQNYF